MTRLGHPPVLLDIIEEHFEELDFLWELREGVIFAPDWNLEELAELEERAEAHLDGLRLAESHAVDIARPALTGEETFAATASTLVFMEAGLPELAAEVLGALQDASAPEGRDGIRIGLRHSNIDGIRGELLEAAASDRPALAAAAADVLAFQRVDVPEVHRLLTAEDAAVRALAYGALGRQRALRQPEDLATALADESPGVQRAALQAAAMSAMPNLEHLCRSAATNRDTPNLEAIRFLGVFGSPTDGPFLQSAAGTADLASAGIAALGALGRVDTISLLIELMQNEEKARDAAAAFTRITGADDVQREPEGTPPVDEEHLEEDLEEDIPLPDAQKARLWWESNRDRFSPQGRWQGGAAVAEALSTPVLNQFMLQARRDLYLFASARGDGAVTDLELEARVSRAVGGTSR